MFKELKKIMIIGIKKGVMTAFHRIEEINKKINIIRKNQTEKK